MGENNQSEIEAFWKEKEESHGGKIQYQSYAVLVGESGSAVMNGRGGLCYVINDRFYFEDFEKQNALMAMFNRKDKDYVKTEISFPLNDVMDIRKISEKWGRLSVMEGRKEEHIPTLSGMMSLFVRGYYMVQLKDRPALIMEIMDLDALKKLIP